MAEAADGEEALEAMRDDPADLVVLDLMLPGIDGLEVCRRLRQTSDVPVIMLTALGGETDRVVGLERGADDYVTKPFSPRELALRVDSVLRRAGESERRRPGPVTDGDLVVDNARHAAYARRQRAALTVREFDLLRFLVGAPGPGVLARRAARSRCGAGPSATSRPSPSTSAGCARRSSPTRRCRSGWSRSGASATAGSRR